MADTRTDIGAVSAPPSAKADAADQLKLSNYLGILRDDPDDTGAYEGLVVLARDRDPERLGEQPVRMLEAARQAHEARGEVSAVAKLLEVEAMLVDADEGDLEVSLWRELGRVRAESLLDPEGAAQAYEKARALHPGDSEIEDALQRLKQQGRSWRKFAKRFVEEADSAGDRTLKTSLLVRAASLVWQYKKKKGRASESEKLFRAALRVDPSNARAALLFEHTLRESERWEALAEHLLDAADNAAAGKGQAGFLCRAGRVFAGKLEDAARAAACYERVLDLEPGNSEAMEFLSEYFTKEQQWDHLVAMYEDALRVRHKLEVEVGILLQISMVHWRMRERPDDAEPYFARLRKLDALHPAVLDFYRRYCTLPERGELLISVLGDAQRVAEGDEKVELALEIARVARQAGLHDRAIDAWKLVQRLSPSHPEATETLRELYRSAEKWNALADVIKAEVEALGESEADTEKKLSLLRELLSIYRDRLHMDGMVVNTLNRILAIAPLDAQASAELAAKYEGAGRWNDLINVLQADAERQVDPQRKVAIYLRVADLWIDRFSNYNQATTPLEAVLELEPGNQDALRKLKEIYERKRAWKQLYEVLRKERAAAADVTIRVTNTIEMARLAADRLQGYADAIALWKEALAEDAQAPGAIEALEKLAERERDWETLREVLEMDFARTQNDEARIRLLQKLAALYGERLSDAKKAADCWRRVLSIEPRHGRALRALRDGLLEQNDWDGLTKLYGDVGDFEALTDVLSGEADSATDPELKIELSFRVASIFEDRIGEPQRAVRSYERVLGIDPGNLRAAKALLPIYEREEKWPRYRAMLEVMLAALPNAQTQERLRALSRLRELSLGRLRDGEAGFDFASQAFNLAPDDPEVRAALESAAEVAESFPKVVGLYARRADRLQESGDEEGAIDLRRRIAQLALERLRDEELAAREYRVVLTLRPEDVGAMATLERLYRSARDSSHLHELLVHRLAHNPDPEVQVATLRELAAMDERAGDLDAARERYRKWVEIEPECGEALSVLDRLALSAERFDELAEVLERRRALATDDGARTELAARLGLCLLDKLAQPSRALDVFQDVLSHDPLHATAISALERISSASDTAEALALSRSDRVRAESMLEGVYEHGRRYDKLLEVLERKLAHEKDEGEVRRLRLRIAEINAHELGDDAGAYSSIEAAFLESPSERSLWDQLADAAERADQQHALASAYATAIGAGDLSDADAAELSTRVARLYDEVLGQSVEAEPFYRKVLAFDPLDDGAFVALKELYTSVERWDDLQRLYRKRIEDTTDGAHRLELLLQVCFLLEEVLERPEHAIETYQQVLVLSPEQLAARRALEKLYEGTERFTDLAELLAGNLDRAEGPERIDILYRLGELYETKLADASVAVDHYERVLADQPHHLRAQDALARLLRIESLRQRIAGLLEPIYESQGAYEELGRVLEIQLEDLETDSARADLLLRIGELHELKTRDAELALSAYARAVECDASHRAAREGLERVAAQRDVFRRRRAEVLERALERCAEDPDLQIELLLELAVLQDEYLDEKAAAERTYERLIEVDPDNADIVLVASRALERLHLEREDYPRLAVDLRRQIRFEEAADTRSSLLIRLADMFENLLDDVDGAIAAHKERLELEPGDIGALRSLTRLYERAGRYEELVEILKRHAEAEDDEHERRMLLRRAASLREDRLGDLDGAIVGYDEVLQSFGPDRETLRALGKLYERTERIPELLECLETELDLLRDEPDSAGEQVGLRFRMAELLRGDPDGLERAIGLYEHVLEAEPGHAGAFDALEAIMKGAKGEARIHAARVAAPGFERAGSFERLRSTLDVLATSDEPRERLDALHRAAEIAEGPLGSAGDAFEYMTRAVEAGVSDPSLSELLSEFERLAELSGRFDDYVTALSVVAPDIYDGELQSQVFRRIARVARDKLQDLPLAIESFDKLRKERPEDSEALDALEALNEQCGRHEALIEVLDHKAAHSIDPQERKALLMRQAEIYERRLDNADKAIEVLEDVIVDEGDAGAYAALERLYTAGLRYADLGALYEQQLDRGFGDAVDLRYKLASNCRQHLAEPERAIEYLRDAVTDDPHHEPSIALLESLMADPGPNRTEAAAILEAGYLARMEWPKLTAALEVRIESEIDVEERRRLLERLAQIYEDQLEDFDGTLSIYARLFAEEPRDQEIWETLHRLAKVGEQWARLGEILAGPIDVHGVEDEGTAQLAKTAGRLYADRLGDRERSAELFARALAFDPRDEEAFRALEASYWAASAYDRLLPLYREQADAAESDERRIELLHARARIFRDQAEEPERAVETYREILEIEPSDAAAIEGLEDLLTRAERYQDLVEHLQMRIDRSLGGPHEAALKLRLAELLEQRLGRVAEAIDVYDEICQSDPKNKPALAALERLVQEPEHLLRITQILEPIYRRLDQWKKLIAIFEAQVEAVDDPAEVVRLLSEIGELHESRGRDVALSLHAWMRAFVKDPANEFSRGHVDRLAAQVGAWDEHVEAYERALGRTDDPLTVGTLLTVLARVHDEKRGDPRAAIVAYERLAEHDPDDPTPLDSLESLHTMVGDWGGVCRALERKVNQAFATDERGELLRRIGTVQEELMGDAEAAIATFVRATEEDDTDQLAYEALDRLYSRAGNLDKLAEVLRRRIELSDEPAVRVGLGVRVGALLDQQLHRPEEAIAAYERVLEDDPKDAIALRALAGLLERQARWTELIENLIQRIAIAEDERERLTLHHRAGEVLELYLDDPFEAIDHYRQALEADPSHGPSIDALMRVSALPNHRERAAEIVEPLLRAQGRWADVVQLVGRAVDQIFDPIDKRLALQKLAEVHEHGQGDLESAFSALVRALECDPADATVLQDLDRLARALGDLARFADVLDNRAGACGDPNVASSLYRALARIREVDLSDDAGAIEAYVHASAHDDDATETLVDLDRLYLKTQRFTDLVDVLDRRVAAAADPAERADLLIRLGDLRDEHFDDGHGAFVAYKEVLEGEPGEARALQGMERLGQRDELASDVLDVLDDCYRQVGAMDKVAGLYDIKLRLASTDGDRLRLLGEAISVWEREIGDLERALGYARRAFELEPDSDLALDEVVRLASAVDGWEALRGMVEGLIERSMVEGHRKMELALSASEWYREHLAWPEGELRCLRWALEVDSTSLEAHDRLIALLRSTATERDLVAALRASADADFDPASRGERLREAGRLCESVLQDLDAAGDCYERVLGALPDDADALDQLARIRAAQERYAESVGLLERRLAQTDDRDERISLRYRVAATYGIELADPDAAIEAYRALLEDAPDEQAAVDALDALLSSNGRFQELLELLEARLDHATELEARTALRVRVAALLERELGDRDRAISEIEAILDEHPGHERALAELERLLAATGRHVELVELLRRRADQAAAASEVAQEVAFLHRAAHVLDRDLEDTTAAAGLYGRVVELSPEDAAAYEALASISERGGDFLELARYLDALMRLQSGDEAVATALGLADLADERLGDLDAAAAALSHVLSVAPDHAEARAQLKALFEKHEAYERLVALLSEEEQAESDAKKKVELLHRIAELYRERLGDPAAAAGFLEKAVELQPGDRPALLALCDIYIAADRQRDAVPVLQQIIESFGGRRAKEVAVYHHRLGRAYEGLGEHGDAMKHYDAAFKIDLTNVHILRDLGRLCMESGNLDRAQKTYRALLLQKLGPEAGIAKADVYFNLGSISFQQGDKIKAKAMLERALSEAPGHAEAQALLDQL